MPPQNSIVFELVHHHLNTLFRAGASDFVTTISARRTIYESDMRAKISLLRVGHFGANRWDILVPIDTITPSPATICTQCKNRPYMYYFLNGGCSIAAPPPPPWLCRRSAAYGPRYRSGYSGGLSPTPQTPQRRPQRALAQGLRLRCAQLSAPKGYNPFRLRFHRQALVLARSSLRSSAAMESPPCGHEFAA